MQLASSVLSHPTLNVTSPIAAVTSSIEAGAPQNGHGLIGSIMSVKLNPRGAVAAIPAERVEFESDVGPVWADLQVPVPEAPIDPKIAHVVSLNAQTASGTRDARGEREAFDFGQVPHGHDEPHIAFTDAAK